MKYRTGMTTTRNVCRKNHENSHNFFRNKPLNKIPIFNYKMSAAETYLETLLTENPIIMFTRTQCPFCVTAKQLLTTLIQAENKSAERQASNRSKLNLVQINFDTFPENENRNAAPPSLQLEEALQAKTSQYTVPNIFINGQHVGGCDSLKALHMRGGVVPLLKQIWSRRIHHPLANRNSRFLFTFSLSNRKLPFWNVER